MRRFLIILSALTVTLIMTACNIRNGAETGGSEVQNGAENGVGNGDENGNEPLLEKYTVIIDVEEYGEITLELDPNAAPITVANFIGLVRDGFYDGLSFHRIMEGFMIQGGCPHGNGTGGSPETIVGEFAANGIENNIDHVRGVISMARTFDPNSASSQFFIVQENSPLLNGEYAGFGHVITGMEIVDAIAANTPVGSEATGEVFRADQPRIASIRVVE